MSMNIGNPNVSPYLNIVFSWNSASDSASCRYTIYVFCCYCRRLVTINAMRRYRPESLIHSGVTTVKKSIYLFLLQFIVFHLCLRLCVCSVRI